MNNPQNFDPIGQFLYALLHPGKLTPTQLGWCVFVALALLNSVVQNLSTIDQVNYYRWIYSPIIAVAFYAAKKPGPVIPEAPAPASLPPATSGSTSGPAQKTEQKDIAA